MNLSVYVEIMSILVVKDIVIKLCLKLTVEGYVSTLSVGEGIGRKSMSFKTVPPWGGGRHAHTYFSQKEIRFPHDFASLLKCSWAFTCSHCVGLPLSG